MDKIKVLLVDDHPIVLAGLQTLLEPEEDIEIVGEAQDGASAIRQVQEAQPDVVLMDITMPGMNSLTATNEILKANPKVKVLVLTMHDDEGYLRQFLSAGVSGYVVKRAASNELLAAIRAVDRGKMFLSISKSVMESYIDSPAKRKRERGKFDNLTERQLKVLKLVAEGYSNQQIADMLGISVKTVETHRASIMKKLQLQGRAELVRYAIQKGLLKIY